VGQLVEGALGEEAEGGLVVRDSFEELCCIGHVLLETLGKEGPGEG
jgi:hypothetical protein